MVRVTPRILSFLKKLSAEHNNMSMDCVIEMLLLHHELYEREQAWKQVRNKAEIEAAMLGRPPVEPQATIYIRDDGKAEWQKEHDERMKNDPEYAEADRRIKEFMGDNGLICLRFVPSKGGRLKGSKDRKPRTRRRKLPLKVENK